MESSFNYIGKTGIEALQELCNLRSYPQPLFLDRSTSNKILITTIVGGKIYGSSEGETLPIACELAAQITLSSWLQDKFNSSLLKPINSNNNKNKNSENHNNNNGNSENDNLNTDSNLNSDSINTDNTNNNNNNSNISQSTIGPTKSTTLSEIASAAAENSQSNSVSLLHLYLTSILPDISSKPNYDLIKSSDGFISNLSLLCNQTTLQATGTGKTKGISKNLSFSFIFSLYYDCYIFLFD